MQSHLVPTSLAQTADARHQNAYYIHFFQIFKERATVWSKNQSEASRHWLPLLDFVFSNWWRLTGSNRRPPACKAGALPAELNPPNLVLFVVAPGLVGLDGFEPSTPALSRRCSNRLSYRPPCSQRTGQALPDTPVREYPCHKRQPISVSASGIVLTQERR